MKTYKLSDMTNGWYIGSFEPSAYNTEQFEVNYRKHLQGEIWDTHYHTEVTEINLLIKGRMTIQNKELNSGDIFIIEPWEVTNPVFLEDCEIFCVKTPSKNDKIIIR